MYGNNERRFSNIWFLRWLKYYLGKEGFKENVDVIGY